MIAWLPILIIVAFPVLYIGAKSADMTMSLIGIILLFAGMSGPIIKRIK